jgi:hypothetical protein
MYAHTKKPSDLSGLPEQNSLMTTHEVAEVFRWSERTIRDWGRGGGSSLGFILRFKRHRQSSRPSG